MGSITTITIFLSLLLLLCLVSLSKSWDSSEFGDPFEDVRFREIHTISCLQNESYPWGCPPNSECTDIEGLVTNICICHVNWINPVPYQYGGPFVDDDEDDHNNNTITSSFEVEVRDNSKEDEGEDNNEHGEIIGTDDDNAIIIADFYSDEDYKIEIVRSRCLGRDDPELNIRDDDPRWKILRVPCLAGCPSNSECRNGKDCICFDGFIGDPVKDYKECRGNDSSMNQFSIYMLWIFFIVSLCN